MRSKLKRKNKFLITFIVSIIAILLCSTSVFAIYIAKTIGTKLAFKIYIVAENGESDEEVKANPPRIVNEMIPVIWNETDSKWQVTTIEDENWYNYSITDKKWANAMMPDGANKTYSEGDEIADSDLGSIFVWIPRFEYKITYYTDETKLTNSEVQTIYGSIEIQFLKTETIAPSPDYTIHPAFTNGTSNSFANGEWDKEIDGFWVSKFEASNFEGEPNQKPGIQNAKTATFSNMYNSAKSATYSLTEENISAVNSHMIKNSEWGAMAYLAYSKYGIDGGNINTNNYWNKNASISGYYADKFNSNGNGSGYYSSLSNMFYYSTKTGINGSTTNNIYGIFDISGGRTEYTAAYLNGVTGTDTFISDGNTKYCTIYTVLTTGTNEEKVKNSSKIGDAIGEVYFFNFNSVGNANTGSGAFYTTPAPLPLSNSQQYIARGGTFSNGYRGAGLVSYYALAGNASAYRGYRTALIIE